MGRFVILANIVLMEGKANRYKYPLSVTTMTLIFFDENDNKELVALEAERELASGSESKGPVPKECCCGER